MYENSFKALCDNIIIPKKGELLTQDEFQFEIGDDKFKIKNQSEKKVVELSKYENDSWIQLCSWFFDEENITKKDLSIIANDFSQILSSKKTPKKSTKKSVNTDGLMFLVNRIATFIPSLRDDIKLEKETSQKFRFIYFLNEKILPKLEEFLKTADEKTKFKFFKNLSEQYSSGNLNVRSFITMGILNNLDFEQYEKFCPNDDFKNTWRQSLKFKGK